MKMNNLCTHGAKQVEAMSYEDTLGLIMFSFEVQGFKSIVMKLRMVRTKRRIDGRGASDE